MSNKYLEWHIILSWFFLYLILVKTSLIKCSNTIMIIFEKKILYFYNLLK